MTQADTESELVVYSPIDRVSFDNRGMTIIGIPLTYDECEMVCDALAVVQKKYFMIFLWSWGDFLAYFEAKHGEKYSQAINSTGLGLQTLANYSWLAKATPKKLRGLPGLGQSHYEQVVKVKDYEVKRGLLQLASDEGWSAEPKLAQAVTALLGPGNEADQHRTGPRPGHAQDELDLARQKQYMLEQQNIQLQLKQEALNGQISQAKSLLEPVLLDQVAPEERLVNIEKAMSILRAEPNGEALALVKEIIHLYRQGNMTALVDTLNKLSLLMED